ncbi:hypothetical protein [Actibacterium ureilyticum]|uniref:hypothetical protein n=1 Tax=Actibacterium ureilyticum TaxID=1590614 RepID=UPI000BAB0F19|nr:hypothetical protein [Actibacterium ureilyticum]
MSGGDNKQFQLTLDTFGKRNQQRFRILEDLSLSCDLCKTNEARQSITEMTRRYFDELKKEEASMNKQLQRLLQQDAKKGGGDKKDDKAREKEAKKMIDKFSSVHVGKNKRLRLKFNGFKNPPYLIFEYKW